MNQNSTPMFHLEKSIRRWLKRFRNHRAYDEASFYEMEMHLRDHIEDLINEGYSERKAFEKAVAAFGDIPSVAEEEYLNLKREKTISLMLYTTLFKNYYKTSIRSIIRNPLSSVINLIGLSAAIGICIFTYSFAQWTYRTDQFHENKHKVFLATFYANRDGKLQQNGRSPRPLGERLKQDFPQIDAVCRVQNAEAVVKYEDEVFHERITFADPTYLSLFTFPLKKGVPSSLEDVNSIILSEEKAIKYFGHKNPIGETLLIKFNKDQKKTFIVAGVAQDFPPSISFNFHFLLHFDNLHIANPTYDQNDWSSFIEATFVHLNDTTGIHSIAQQMDKYRVLQNEAKKDWQVASFAFEPLATLHKRSATIRNVIALSTKEGYTAILFLSFVGIFMLVIACFNYINIAVVSAVKRLKEIGIRKAIGAHRRVIIVQFLTENIIATSLALILGLVLGAYLFIPWFESLFYFDMGFRWSDTILWMFLPIVLLVTAFASGLYPAFYISRVPVTGILKGSFKFGKKNRLTRVMLAFQLILSCVFITCAIMFTQNVSYLASRSWGYNEDLALYTEVPDLSSFRLLEVAMKQEKDVLSISGSSHHLGKNSSSTVIELPDQEHEAQQIAVDANYFETLGIDLIEGRGFQEHSKTDKKTIIINEQFQETILQGNPIGKIVKIDGERYTVVGMVKDFHAYNFDTEIKPTFFKIAHPEEYRYLSVKVEAGTQRDVYRTLQNHWISFFPETPFQGGYQEDVWGMYFVEVGIHGKVWRGIATIAIILAGLGLYGLVTLNISGRVREFSIRKVLGAGLGNIAKNISKHYLWLFIIALSIGAPVSYFLISIVFDIAYTYHMPINIWGVALAVLILVVILLIVVATQLLRVFRANPVEGLQVE